MVGLGQVGVPGETSRGGAGRGGAGRGGAGRSGGVLPSTYLQSAGQLESVISQTGHCIALKGGPTLLCRNVV